MLKKAKSPNRPDVFSYHDYVDYFRDWLAYKKASQPRFSTSGLAKAVGLTPGFLSLVLSRSRHLTAKASLKLLPALELGSSERAYFEQLIVLGTSDLPAVRFAALERMKRFRGYQKANPKEAEVYSYLTRWYYVAIREMAALPDFKLEPEWIQSRLKTHVDLLEIKKAIEFLKSNGYLEVLKDGSIKPPEKRLDCLEGVYRMALSRFHREMLSLAAESFDKTPSNERRLMGHAVAFDEKSFKQACEIVEEAITKIQALNPTREGAVGVYFAEFALFPLTRRE